MCVVLTMQRFCNLRSTFRKKRWHCRRAQAPAYVPSRGLHRRMAVRSDHRRVWLIVMCFFRGVVCGNPPILVTANCTVLRESITSRFCVKKKNYLSYDEAKGKYDVLFKRLVLTGKYTPRTLLSPSGCLVFTNNGFTMSQNWGYRYVYFWSRQAKHTFFIRLMADESIDTSLATSLFSTILL